MDRFCEHFERIPANGLILDDDEVYYIFFPTKIVDGLIQVYIADRQDFSEELSFRNIVTSLEWHLFRSPSGMPLRFLNQSAMWISRTRLMNLWAREHIMKRILNRHYDAWHDKLWKPPNGLMVIRLLRDLDSLNTDLITS